MIRSEPPHSLRLMPNPWLDLIPSFAPQENVSIPAVNVSHYLSLSISIAHQQAPLLWVAEMSELGVRRGKAALSNGCKSHPANAQAGSNRSGHGGDEMAEAFESSTLISNLLTSAVGH